MYGVCYSITKLINHVIQQNVALSARGQHVYLFVIRIHLVHLIFRLLDWKEVSVSAPPIRIDSWRTDTFIEQNLPTLKSQKNYFIATRNNKEFFDSTIFRAVVIFERRTIISLPQMWRLHRNSMCCDYQLIKSENLPLLSLFHQITKCVNNKGYKFGMRVRN